MNKIENNLIDLIKASLKEKYGLDVDNSLVMIEIPKDKANGDYSTNIAMRLAKELKKAPVMIANELKEVLEKSDLLERVDVAGPGFINFIVNKGELSGVISNILKQEDNYGSNDKYKDVTINVEYVSVNPTGDIHPGHARGASVGDSLTRMMKKLGYKVTREYYVNDAGNQIDNLGKSIFVRYHELFNVTMDMPEDGYHGQDIYDIARAIKEEVNDKYLNADYETCKTYFKEYGTKFELDKLKADLDLFRVNFDVWTSEKTLYSRNLVNKSLDILKDNGMIYEAEGATWLKTTEYGDDKDRVLVKTDGSYTYFCPDIAYHLDKFDRGNEYLIDVLGADHHGYIPRLKAAIKSLGHKPENLDVIIIQMVRLIKDGEEFKLSKRSGKAIALRDIIEEAGVDATRYFFVSKAPNTQMDFDIDIATKQSNDNPVYYVQYAHARMCSILRNDIQYDVIDSYDLIKEEKETLLLKHLNEFPSVIEECVEYREPHRMCNYVYKLAQLFHSFYNECKVIDKDNMELTKQRLALVKACQITLKNALALIGVSAPEKM
ncbi:MAG: arginine--tRNA ligase [Erysipelotrichaceae bacterium]|nr:arginine--tRNA ligase [Erysipelotrichaceae bacterium]